LKTFHVRYGVEGHLKGAVDRYFSMLDRRLHRANMHTDICSLDDVIDAYKAGYHSRTDPTEEEFFMQILPVVTRAAWSEKHTGLALECLPLKIRVAHSSSFISITRRGGS
jgi:hypothetical protein